MPDDEKEDVLQEGSPEQIPEKPQEQLPAQADVSIESPKPDNMEVHHHPDLHHEKKNFREYFLEFLMIFLAVTMGFFAESFREHISEQAKEKEYILSMLEDVQTDTANIRIASAKNVMRMKRLDSLATLCFNYDGSGKDDANIYRLYRHSLAHPDFVSPTERTLTQLKNSGAMRLIRNKAVVDSVVLYDDLGKKLADQQTYYERYQNETVQSSVPLINFDFFNLGKPGGGKPRSLDSARLLNPTKKGLIEFGNRVSLYMGVVSFYNDRLAETRAHAISLMTTLRNQYNLPPAE